MTIDDPARWARDRHTIEAGLWALDVTTGTWTNVYMHEEEFRRREEDFVFCGYREAARIYADLRLVEPAAGPVAAVDKNVDNSAHIRSA